MVCVTNQLKLLAPDGKRRLTDSTMVNWFKDASEETGYQKVTSERRNRIKSENDGESYENSHILHFLSLWDIFLFNLSFASESRGCQNSILRAESPKST